MEVKNKKIAFVITDCSFDFEKLLQQIKKLKKLGALIFPIIDNLSFNTDVDKKIEKFCETRALHSIEDIKEKKLINSFDIMIIAPASENTISKLACDIIDTPVLMIVKSHLRNNLPTIIAPSSLDGLRSKSKIYC